MKSWFELNWDWLLSAIFIAVVTSTTIGLKEGTKGGAIAVSNFSSAIMVVVLYPFLTQYGYATPALTLLLGLFCGGCGLAMFSVLIALSSLIERRRAKIAQMIADRVLPEGRDK